MGTVHELTERRDKLRDQHLAATAKQRDELSEEIALLSDRIKRGRGNADELSKQIEEARSARDAILHARAEELGPLEAQLSAARKAEKAAAAKALHDAAVKACAGLSVEKIEALELAARADGSAHLARAEALAAHLNELRCNAAADAAIAQMSPLQRAQHAAALERSLKTG